MNIRAQTVTPDLISIETDKGLFNIYSSDFNDLIVSKGSVAAATENIRQDLEAFTGDPIKQGTITIEINDNGKFMDCIHGEI